MEIWQAFIDESGDFDGPDNVVIAAVLCRNAGPSRSALRAGLEAALPGIPYPPHAAHLHVRSFPAAALLFDPSLARRAPEIVREAATLLSQHDAPEAHAVRREAARCRSEGRPAHYMDLHTLQRADGWFSRTDLDRYDALRVVLTTHQRTLLDWMGFMRDAFTIVAAGQAGADTTQRGAARYRAVLDCTLERVEQLLGGAPVTVMVRSSRRHDSRELALGTLPGHPKPIAARAARMEPYGSDVHPAFVIADTAANRLRYTLQGSWQQVRDRWGCALPLERAPRFIDTALPVVIACDTTQRAIRHAFERRPKQELLSGLPRVGSRWQHDQAAAWIGATP